MSHRVPHRDCRLVVWFVRMVITSRRWNKLSKVQTEVHSKLLDRFTANEDLLAYMQTQAGRSFLESAPLPRRAIRPVARRSRASSVRAGGSRAPADGIGLLYVSGTFIDEPAEFFVIGVVALALGAGFIISAVAAYACQESSGCSSLRRRPCLM